jgi:Flp pilus assembly protein CpaB
MPPVLAEGMRAVSVSVDSLPGDAPNVRSGDRVDILLTRDVGGQLVSKVILQDITVIAVSKQEDIGAGSPVVEQSDRKAMERLEAALLVG